MVVFLHVFPDPARIESESNPMLIDPRASCSEATELYNQPFFLNTQIHLILPSELASIFTVDI